MTHACDDSRDRPSEAARNADEVSVLIVDDEVHALEGLRRGVDWRTLGVGRLAEARNVRQAQAVLLAERIDIVVCDIEMPQGSGLDLVAWVNANRPGIDSLFLTCHAEFSYAQRAVQLGSFDYLLKPVPYGELEQALRRLIERRALRKLKAEYPGLGAGGEESGREGWRSTVERVKRFVQDHVAEDITCGQIAEHVRLNPDYLSRVFKREVGQPIHDYLIATKMAAARELLGQTSLSVSEIASRVGYSNFSHFSAAFKGHFGATPSAFRATGGDTGRISVNERSAAE